MDDRDYDLIARNFSGEASPDDAASLRAWVAEDPSRARLLEELHRIWEEGSAPIAPSGRVDARWSRLARRVAASEPEPLRIPVARHRFGITSGVGLLRAAAVIAVLIVAGLVWRMGAGSPSQMTASLKEARTAKAQRLALRLPDGTRVVLAPASRLTYDGNSFGKTDRAVQLEGEAYFDVQHDALPFSVRADGVVARDLGTRFTARAFPGEITSVAVAEGRVGMAKASDTVSVATIEPGQVGTLSAGELKVGRNRFPENFFAWTEGRLVFRDTPLSDALLQLDRWYDVRFTLADPALGRRPLTASFGSETLSEVLDLLSVTLDLDLRRSGNTITIRAAAK